MYCKANPANQPSYGQLLHRKDHDHAVNKRET